MNLTTPETILAVAAWIAITVAVTYTIDAILEWIHTRDHPHPLDHLNQLTSTPAIDRCFICRHQLDPQGACGNCGARRHETRTRA
jgi:hypothetical protein